MKVGVLAVEPKREQWGHKAEFILSCVGYAVGLGNIWRFPYLCFKNGGASFLIPYGSMLLFCGIPIFYMELALGQFLRKGASKAWASVCPAAAGIGVAMMMVSGFISIYYNVIIAWSLLYLWNSLAKEIPFKHCKNPWNTLLCRDADTNVTCASLGLDRNCTLHFTTPSEEFWTNKILHSSSGVEQVGEVRYDLATALLIAWIVVYLCVSRGIRSSGKIAYFSATFPYFILMVLIVRGATLPGAYQGVLFYLSPDFSRLADPQTWIDAASQIFFSLSVGLGGLIVFGSYNNRRNNCEADAITVSLINCVTSFVGGFATFTVLGFMAHSTGLDVKEVVSSGPGLAFVAYPESIARMPVSPLWAILFFFMLFLLGIDSQFVFIETIMGCLCDQFSVIKSYKKTFLAILCTLCYLIGLCCVTEGGIYMFNIFDRQAGGFSLIFISIFECLVVGWSYGVERFCDNIEEMLGWRPNLYFRLCWKYISPTVVTIIFFWSASQWSGITYNDYKYPLSGELIGWGLAASSMSAIPIGFLIVLYQSKGSLKNRFVTAFTPNIQISSEVWEFDLRRRLNMVFGKPLLKDIVSESLSLQCVATPEGQIQKLKRLNRDKNQKESKSIPSSWIRGLNLPPEACEV